MPKKSSRQWLREHFNDPYVKQAQKEGYRSRAAYKLLELHQRDKLFRPGMVVVDLGAAPGGWSQVVTKLVGKHGRVIAIDILPMLSLSGVDFIQTDFSDIKFPEILTQQFSNLSIDWVISDMAPNLSGIDSVDQAKSIQLAEEALQFAIENLKPEGGFLVKTFQGEGFEGYIKTIKTFFQKVCIRKPKASRDRSREVYILAKTLK